ncbi:MAG: preprotein translocase subunit SecG [Methylophilaceae bacterium]|nr:preprotein translocase subunit SecG [Methylophilaceae bacterium]
MEKLIWIVHVLAALGVIGLVLLQHGKGADMGAAFGSGASGSLFGVSGSSNFLSRTTAILITIFFLTSLTLAYMSGHRNKQSSVVKMHEQTLQSPAGADAAKQESPAGPQPPAKSREIPR